ncbi:hypothetical protein JRO89_XS06G0134200 [Xanthoceras sorbifolium]|uniref:Uncharacterized protein n=1 Tax=Xanthoceras sorbifolium TaxID=99658 RepID=A0ABQ8HY73_9ROSI|nr:hypothetical protein JRO89_XS06G0134200 [Xanthoceras sorbifolium]
MTSGNQPLSEEGPDCREILGDITQYLLSDTQLTAASDEESLMSLVKKWYILPLQLQYDSRAEESDMMESHALVPVFKFRKNMPYEQHRPCPGLVVCSLMGFQHRIMKYLVAVRALLTPKLATQSLHVNGESCGGRPDDGNGINAELNNTFELMPDNRTRGDIKAPEGDAEDASGSKSTTGMSRKDSFWELLLHLPRIASLPKFLFNISEDDGESQAR